MARRDTPAERGRLPAGDARDARALCRRTRAAHCRRRARRGCKARPRGGRRRRSERRGGEARGDRPECDRLARARREGRGGEADGRGDAVCPRVPRAEGLGAQGGARGAHRRGAPRGEAQVSAERGGGDGSRRIGGGSRIVSGNGSAARRAGCLDSRCSEILCRAKASVSFFDGRRRRVGDEGGEVSGGGGTDSGGGRGGAIHALRGRTPPHLSLLVHLRTAVGFFRAPSFCSELERAAAATGAARRPSRRARGAAAPPLSPRRPARAARSRSAERRAQ
jgi:hypothetical protein